MAGTTAPGGPEGEGTLAITGIGTVVTGVVESPRDDESDTVVIRDGRIAAVGRDLDLDGIPTVVDAGGLVLVPGLVDGHSHPVVGGFNPKQGLYDFVSYYVRAGVVGFVSMGAVHFPGFHGESAEMAVAIAREGAVSSRPRAGQALVDTGCLLATPDMTPAHLDDAAAGGVRRLKFLYSVPPETRRSLARHAAELGWVTMVHCGGTSVGGSAPLGFEDIVDFGPRVLAHLNGGPTSLPVEDVTALVRDTDAVVDVVKCGNPRRAVELVGLIDDLGAWDRLVLGTDSPTASGMVPSGMWYLVALLSSFGGHRPEKLIAAATGTSSRLYWEEPRVIAPGAPGTVLLVGAPAGGVGSDALDALALGDLPGLAAVVIDGRLVDTGGVNTPPPHRPVTVYRGGSV